MSTQTGSISFEATGGFNSYAKQNYATLSQIKGQFATCGTGASTAAKVATIVPEDSGWELYTGATVTVKFTSKNTTSAPTLNVNGTGAKSIKDFNGNNLDSDAYNWPEGAAMSFTYDGTSWRLQDSDLMERVHTAETSIEQTATSITSLASMSDTYTKPDGTTGENAMKSYVDQTAEGINTTISSMQTDISNKADGSTVTTLSNKVNTMSDTVDGHTQSISSINSTITTKADKSAAIAETTQLWFSKADTTAPNKPTAVVTSTSTDGNAWRTVVPAYNASYPNYFYCYQWKYVDGTYNWSAVTRDIAMGESQERARTAITNAANAQTTANANIKSSVMLWFSKANDTAPSKPTTVVTTSNAATGNTWNLLVPTYNSTYPYYFYCYQQQKGDGTYQWSDVVYDRATTESQSTARAASSSLANYITSNDAAMQSLQNQVDGQVEVWYFAADPAETSYAATATPTDSAASTWTTAALKNRHLGDLYYNTVTGHSWRWMQDGDNYKWLAIPDSDAAAALAAANAAQTTANGKRRIFTTTPTTPYDIGDLWVDGSQVKYAKIARSSGDYVAADWEQTATDDTAANAAQATANKNVKESIQLWFTKADTTAPSKPSAVVTNNNPTGSNSYNKWNIAVPVYNDSYKYYFYCYQWKLADNTYNWSDVVYDQATTENQANSRAAKALAESTQEDYAEFKQTVNEFQSTIGSTYATKTELSNGLNNLDNVIETSHPLIEQTNATASDTWTGVAPFDTLEDGQEIDFWKIYNWANSGYTNTTNYWSQNGCALNLTLADGSTTGAIPIWYNGNTRLTSHYQAGSLISMVYKENYLHPGYAESHRVAKGWYCKANYNTDTVYSRSISGGFYTGLNGVLSYGLCMKDQNGRWTAIVNNKYSNTTQDKTPYTGGLELGEVLYCSTWYTNGRVTTNNTSVSGDLWSSNIFDFRFCTNISANSTAGKAMTVRQPVYLVGTLNETDGLFYLDSTQWWTQTPNDTTKIYIYLGTAYSWYQLSLVDIKPFYVWDGTKLVEFAYSRIKKNETDIIQTNEQITLQAASTLEAAKTYTNGEIATEVTNRNAAINTKASEITSSVSQTYATKSTVNGIETRVSTAESTITQHATDIEAKVSKDGVIAAINLSTETENGSTAKISADKVNIEGAAIFSSGSLSKVVTSTQTQWYSSTSATTKANGSWGTTQPAVTAGRYIWERQYITYSNGDTEYKPSEAGVCTQGQTDLSSYSTTTQMNSAIGTAVDAEENARKAIYGTCTTAAGTAAKTVSCANFELYTGASVTVYFQNNNTSTAPTLNVNSTGAKTIKSYTGAALSAAEYGWAAASICTFTYDGTYWRMQDGGALQAKADAATYASNASTSASNASTSASNAASSASAASTSASNASSSASTASTKASEASTSASNAASSATTATSQANAASTSATNAASSASAASTSATNAATSATNAANSATAAAEVMGGYTILWNYENFTTANNGEAYICKLDPLTGTKSDENGWVKWNGTKRTITKQMVNPNAILPYNIPIYLVCRLGTIASPSSTSTTATNAMVWYNSGWKYATMPTPTSVGGDWTWNETCDIIIGKFVETASEAAFVEMELYNPPWGAKQLTTTTTTAASAQATANTANTTANNAAPKSSAVSRTQRIYYRTNTALSGSITGPTTWISETGNKYNTTAPTTAITGWSTKPTPLAASTASDATKYLYLYTCIQTQTVAQAANNGTACSASTVLLDDTETIIDGGKIITGSVTANQIAADAVTAEKINVTDLQAIGATIGGFQIDTSSIHTKNVAITSNADNSIALSSADFTRTINGTSRAGLRLAMGDKFAVTGDGAIYASSVDLTGKITATSGTIGGASIDSNGKLQVPAAQISGTLSASQIDVSSINIGDLAGEIGGRNLLVGNAAKPATWTITNTSVTTVVEQDSPYNCILTYSQLVGGWEIVYSPEISVSSNVEYTLSIDYSVNKAWTVYGGGDGKFGLEVCSGIPASGKSSSSVTVYGVIEFPTAITTKTRSFIKFTPTNDSIRLVFNGGNITDGLTNISFWIGHLQLEKGNVATDWTPAPEDVASDIDDAATTATNYIHADSTNGLKIAQSSPSSATTNYVQIKSDGVYNYYNSSNYTKQVSDGFYIYEGGSLRTKIGSGTIDLYAGAATYPKTSLSSSGVFNYYDSTHYSKIVSDGLHVYSGDASNDVALFGTTTRIGTVTGARTQLTSTGVELYNSSNQKKVSIGTGASYFYGGAGTYPYIEVNSSSSGAINIKQSATSYTSITSSGMDIYAPVNSTATNIASFGTTARLGRADLSRFLMNADSLQAYNSSNTKYFEVSASGLTWGSNNTAESTTGAQSKANEALALAAGLANENLITYNPDPVNTLTKVYIGQAKTSYPLYAHTGAENTGSKGSPFVTNYTGNSATSRYLMFCPFTPINFTSGDVIRFEGRYANWDSAVTNARLCVWCYSTNTGSNTVTFSSGNISLAQNTWADITAEVTITATTDLTTSRYFLVGLDVQANRRIAITANSRCFKVNQKTIDAAKTATNYMSFDSTNGLKIAQSSPSSASTTKFVQITPSNGILIQNDASNYARVNSSGLTVFQGNTAVASFNGTSSQIGPSSNGHSIIDSSGMEIFTDSSTSVAKFGGTGARVGAEDGMNVLVNSDGLELNAGDEDYPYFRVKDLRGADGVYTETIGSPLGVSYDPGTPSFEWAFDISNFEVKLASDGSSDTSNWQASGNTLTRQSAITAAARYFFTLSTTSVDAKSFTFGSRSYDDGDINDVVDGGLSVTFGHYANATGFASFASGGYCSASSDYAHAEGWNTFASGRCSHAEGMANVQASGNASHAEGTNTIASGAYSHAQNLGTTAAYQAQTAIGKYNENKSDNLFEIGNGTNSSPSNILEASSTAVYVKGLLGVTNEIAVTNNVTAANVHQALHARISAARSLSTSYQKITMAANTTVGIDLSVSSGGIKCAKAGTVLVSGQAYFNDVNDTNVCNLALYKNSGQWTYTSHRASGQRAMLYVSPILVNVAAGDILYLYASNTTTAAGSIPNTASATYMTVQYV